MSTQEEVLDALTNHGAMSKAELELHLGASASRLTRALHALRDDGKVHVVGRSKKAKWTLSTSVADQVLDRVTKADPELITKFILAIVEAGSIEKARQAFGVAVDRLGRLR